MNMDPDVFATRSAKPMLIAENKPAFNSPDYIYELKFDGIRALAYLDEDGTTIINKRDKNLNPVFPELTQIHRSVGKRCILDGEIVVFIGGKPSFSTVQARALMSNLFKIEMSYKKAPASFVAFDILYYDGQRLTNNELLKRRQLMREAIKNETQQLIISKYIEEKGMELYRLAENENLEGIVAKRKNSRYYFGKRTMEWIKCNNMIEDDLIVCGYCYKAKSFISVILNSTEDERLIYRGYVVIGANRQDFKIMQSAPACNNNIYQSFPLFEGARWIEPILTCNVEYMHLTANGDLRQPVYRGLKSD